MNYGPYSESELLDIARRSLERRQRISAAKRGKPHSDSHRRALAEGVTRWWAERRAAKAAEQSAVAGVSGA